MKVRFLLIIGFVVFIVTIAHLNPHNVYAEGPLIGSGQASQSAGNESCNDAASCTVNIPRSEASGATIQNIMKIVFAVAAVLSVVFVAVGGFKYTISGGDASGLQSAKNTILYAVVGLMISVSAYTIVQFVIGRS